MRTTVEITDAQRAALLRLAAERGEKGFSGLVRAALARYLTDAQARTEAVQRALKLRGTLVADAAKTLTGATGALRRKWR